MKSHRLLFALLTVVCLSVGTHTYAQAPSVLYTWDNSGNATPDVEAWVKNFGANTVALDNTVAGTLRIVEMGGSGQDVAISDGANRVRESSTAASGGTDLTGLDFLEFTLGHSGSGPIPVQFFVQAGTGFTFKALGPDVNVVPALTTYQLPLSSLAANELVYLRTMGFNARTHAAVGDVVWTLNEVRASGTPLSARDLATFDTGTAEGGLQGALVNFDGASVLGNTGQNQTGLSHNPAGSGSLQWTDVAGGAGGAISLGNGTALNGNTFNNRTSDLSNYRQMIVRISAAEISATAPVGTVDVQAFFQKNNFAFEAVGSQSLPTDGQFRNLVFNLPASLQFMNVVDQTGLNLGSHATQLTINLDLVRFVVPEPAAITLVGIVAIGGLSTFRRRRQIR